jgi:hypothetical protein
MPMIGQLLASERGRGAYLMTRVDNRGTRRHPTEGEHELLVMTVERVPRGEMLVEGAVVHWIAWDKRVKKPRRLDTSIDGVNHAI